MKIALTFDDGPSQWTEAILTHLRNHHAKATFFVVGASIHRREDTLRHVWEEGHLIGNHTLTHPHLTSLDDAAVLRELSDTQELIAEVTGHPPKWWRAPHLDLDDRVEALARTLGLTHVGCTIDPADWAEPDAERIARVVLDRVEDGAIIDLHDGVPPGGGSGTRDRTPTVDAVEVILTRLDTEFVTVDALL